jgi:hypothetical protein
VNSLHGKPLCSVFCLHSPFLAKRGKGLGDRGFLKLFLLIYLCGMLLGCSAENPSNPPNMPTLEAMPLPVSAWGEVLLVSQAEDLNGASFISLAENRFFVWTGSQEGEARLFSRGVQGNSQIMALKAYHPLQTRLFTGDERVLLLWLDREFNTVDMRLQAALLAYNGLAEIGVISLSEIPTRDYASFYNEDQSVTIVYSGGLSAINNLYLQRVDNAARSFLHEELRANAEFPALMNDANGLLLFWLEDNGQVAHLGRLGERDLSEVRRIARASIGREASVEEFYVGFDGSHAWLFWQIRNWDGSRYSLMSVGMPDGDFSEPTRLEASWAIPAESVPDSGLPIALNIGNQLGIALLNNGIMGEFQPIVETGVLLGAPKIQRLPNGRLALSWSVPSPSGFANLYYTEESQ